jgi:6-phosphogluconolactonase
MAQIFPSDERPTPPDDARSNYGMHRRLLLDRLEVPVENQHAFPAWEKQPSQGALEAEAELRRVVRPRLEGGLPAFDLALLGLGADGHTASLFPGTEPLEETEAWIVPTVRPEDGEVRLTLTYPALRRAGTLLFLVTGKEKSEAVRRALRPEGSAPPPPAVRVDQGRGLWILDRAAASDLSADLFE